MLLWSSNRQSYFPSGRVFLPYRMDALKYKQLALPRVMFKTLVIMAVNSVFLKDIGSLGDALK
jgi:hypothetical protein